VDSVTGPTRAPVVRFAPDRRLTAAAGAGALVAVLLSLTTADLAGRLLWAGAAVVLLGYVATDLIWSPRLAADATGVRIRSPFARADLRWDEIHSVTADVRSRYGLRSSSLEVDAGDLLVVFSRRSLGADPETVAGLVQAMQP
jgi:Bacterial PH domain